MARFAHIAVIDPAVKTAEVDCFNHLVSLSPLPMTYHLPALFGMASLNAVNETAAGIIILGSSSSVHDRYPWQAELASWLKPRLERGVPTFGICFGHQFIAHLYGAEVGFLYPDKKKEQGFRHIRLEGGRLWGKAAGEVFVSHREGVTTVPKGFRQVGKSDAKVLEAFEHESLPIVTIQAHPEATSGLLANLGYEGRGPLDFGHGLVSAFIRKINPSK